MHFHPKSLEAERRLYETMIEEWRKTYLGKVVVIKGEDVLGFFTNLDEACRAGGEAFGLEPFFMTEIRPRESINISLLGRSLRSA